MSSTSSATQATTRRLAIRGSGWIMAGHGAGQALRLGINLILTRLLIPDFFGLMALVQIFSQGVMLLSDIGLRGNIVYHERGDDPVFLNTAWTVQAIRGALLWAILCVAAQPAAALYEEPRLEWLIPVLGLGLVITGFQSTAMYTLDRHVNVRRRVAFDLGCQIGGIAVMIGWALASPTVWSLVAGNLFSSVLTMVSSHFLIRGYTNRFSLESQAVRSIVGFGKWILLSTAIMFLLAQGDRIVLGKLLTLGDLGVYTIASMLAMTVVIVIGRLSRSILFPLFARVARESSEELRRSAAWLRLRIVGLGLPPLWLLAIFGQDIVDVLYDDRYIEAGWMAQILAFGAMGSVLTASAERLLLAKGDSYRYMLAQLAQVVLLIIGITAGALTGGIPGLLVGLSASRWLGYAALDVMLRRQGLWMPGLDAGAVGLSGMVLWIALALN